MGKQTFFEPSIRVPLIVRHPALREAVTVKEVVSLTDVYSTILAAAGADPDSSNDSIPLPGLDLPGSRPRAHVFGYMKYADMMGSMVTDQEWKYCRYSNGMRMLYHLPTDPREQRNLADDPQYAAKARELDDVIFREVSQSILEANLDKKVEGPGAIKIGPFNQRGWKRPYPYHPSPQ